MKLRKSFVKVMILFFFVSLVLASLPQFIPEVKAQYTNWTWNVSTTTLTIISESGYGDSWGTAYSLADIASGDIWGYTGTYWIDSDFLYGMNNRQYQQDMKIVIGDNTYLWVENAQISLVHIFSSVTTAYQLSSSGHLRFGEIYDSSRKLSQSGVSILACAAIIILDINLNNNAEVEIYSSLFQAEKSLVSSSIIIGTNDKVYNSVFDNVRILNAGTSTSTPDIYDVEIKNIGSTYNALRTSGSSDKIFIYDSGGAFQLQTNLDLTIKNVLVRNVTYLAQVSAISTDKYFVNVDSDIWNWVAWTSGNAEIWRQYEFDLTTDANANIEITYYGQGGGTIYNDTDADGIIPTQTISKGFYNRTGASTIYSYEPLHLKVSKDGYQTYEADFTLEEKTSREITLTPTVEATGITSMAPFFLLGMLIMIPIGVLIWKKH